MLDEFMSEGSASLMCTIGETPETLASQQKMMTFLCTARTQNADCASCHSISCFISSMKLTICSTDILWTRAWQPQDTLSICKLWLYQLKPMYTYFLYILCFLMQTFLSPFIFLFLYLFSVIISDNKTLSLVQHTSLFSSYFLMIMTTRNQYQ